MHKHNYTLHNYTLSNNFVWPFRVAIKLRMKYKMWKKPISAGYHKKNNNIRVVPKHNSLYKSVNYKRKLFLLADKGASVFNPIKNSDAL